jgi:hypothetical protein
MTRKAQAPSATPVAAADAAAAPTTAADVAAEEALDPHPGFIAMVHPDNGLCDSYKADENGALLVPYDDIGIMMAHGFVPAQSAEG